jgi:hypothetical protein
VSQSEGPLVLYVGDADRRFAFAGQIAASTRHSVRQAQEPPRTGACVEREDAWTVDCGRSVGRPHASLGSRRGLSRVPRYVLDLGPDCLVPRRHRYMVALNFAAEPVLALRRTRQEARNIWRNADAGS